MVAAGWRGVVRSTVWLPQPQRVHTFKRHVEADGGDGAGSIHVRRGPVSTARRCVCVCVRACVRACVRGCVRARASVRAGGAMAAKAWRSSRRSRAPLASESKARKTAQAATASRPAPPRATDLQKGGRGEGERMEGGGGRAGDMELV